ncbi:MAG: glycosyltransferase family 2 protein [Nitrospiraceae bacterium]
MFEPRKVIVLLATYNGAEFLSEQIQSIQGQAISNWTLLVRDDGSEDNTRDVLEKLATKDKRIRCIQDTRGCLGAARNFGELMRVAWVEGADIVFFSDQDDVWLETKMMEQIAALDKMENSYGRDTPILVYSDLEVVDRWLQPIDRSFMRYQGLTHEAQSPVRVLLTQNFVTGCATVINRSLLKLAVPLPADVVMHDWWLALCAAACGQIGHLPSSTLRYRQHDSNQIGAQRILAMMNPLSLRTRRWWKEGGSRLFKSIGQAAVLSERIVSRDVPCSVEALSLLKRFAACAQEGRFRRLWTVSQLGLQRQGVFRQLLLYWRLLVSRRGAITD